MRGGAPIGHGRAGAPGAEEPLDPTESSAAAEEASGGVPREDSGHTEEMPRVRLTRRRLAASVIFVVSTVAFLYFVLPKLLGLRDTWNRIQHGNGWWLALAAVLECCSFLAYVFLFRGVFVRGKSRIGWRAYLGNEASRRVAEKAGFTIEGVGRGVCVQRGQRRDAWLGALLAGD